MTQIAFARQSAGSVAYQEHSGERLLNCYVRPFPDQGVGPFIIAFSPGLTQFASLGTGPVRAVYAQRGTVYAACDGKLWRVTGGVVSEVGVINDGPTSISGNGTQVFLAAGGEYYVSPEGTSLTTPASGAFDNVLNVAALDGYAILAEKDGERFSISGLYAAQTVDALDFASAEGAPDYLVRAHVDHSELWLFGTKSIEIWQNTGGGDFPFSRMSGAKLDRGCAFGESVASEDNSVFWVGDDRVVYRAAGYQPTRVSTQWVESILQDATEARGFTFTLDGSKVYALRLPNRPALLFDIASGLWHERSTGLEEGPWLATCACRCETVIFGGSDGKLYQSGGVLDGTQPIMREGVSLPVTMKRERMTVNAVQLNFKTGATQLGRDAQVMLQVSRDGRTWSPERWRPMGQIGQYDRLVRWHGWGQARQFRWRFRITDPIEGALYGATLE